MDTKLEAVYGRIADRAMKRPRAAQDRYACIRELPLSGWLKEAVIRFLVKSETEQTVHGRSPRT